MWTALSRLIVPLALFTLLRSTQQTCTASESPEAQCASGAGSLLSLLQKRVHVQVPDTERIYDIAGGAGDGDELELEGIQGEEHAPEEQLDPEGGDQPDDSQDTEDAWAGLEEDNGEDNGAKDNGDDNGEDDNEVDNGDWIGKASYWSKSPNGLYSPANDVLDLDGEFPWKVKPQAWDGCPVLMEFYASWCPHCIKYAPEYKKFAHKVESSSDVFAYTIAAVDCAMYEEFCRENGIQSYPTVKDFGSGSITDSHEISPDVVHNQTALWDYLVNANNNATKRLGQQNASACAQMRSQLLKGTRAMQNDTVSGGTTNVTIPHPNHVWLADQQRALFMALGAEPIRAGVFYSNRTKLLSSLRAFLSLAAHAFPHKDTRLRLAKEVVPALDEISAQEDAGYSSLEDVGYIAGERWKKKLAWLEPAKSDGGYDYFGCRGSMPHKRGFTCALWQTFHGLLANSAYDTGHKHKTHIGLAAVHGWIQNFFACGECRRSFLQMADQMHWRDVKTDDEAVLWLWRAHNSVNKRLEKDSTADPSWPKVQFPSSKACPQCSAAGKNGFANQPVLKFLRKFYGTGDQWQQ